MSCFMLSILQPKASLSSSAIKTEVFGILLPTDIVIAIKHAEDNASEKFIFLYYLYMFVAKSLFTWEFGQILNSWKIRED